MTTDQFEEGWSDRHGETVDRVGFQRQSYRLGWQTADAVMRMTFVHNDDQPMRTQAEPQPKNKELAHLSEDDNEFVVAEVRIEECVTELIEHFWESITNDDDFADEKIEDLAAHLGLPLALERPDMAQVDRYHALYSKIVRATWAGLASKLTEELGQLTMRDLDAEYA